MDTDHLLLQNQVELRRGGSAVDIRRRGDNTLKHRRINCMLRYADFSHGNNARVVFLHKLGL